MSSATVYSAVKAFLIASWTTTPLVFDNANEAENLTKPWEGTSPWVSVEMTSDYYGAESIGAGSDAANLYRERGVIFPTVMVPSGTGSLLARQHAKALIDLFRGLDLVAGRVIFREMSIGLGENRTENGNWYALPCSIEYQADM